MSKKLSACAAFIIREAMRLYDKTLLLVPSEVARRCSADDTLLYETVPLRRRHNLPPGNATAQAAAPRSPQSALRLVTKRMLCTPRATILSKIVVVGEGTCALSAIQELMMAGDCFLPNVTLVSPSSPNKPDHHKTAKLDSTMTCCDVDALSPEEFDALGAGSVFSTHVGHVTQIDRASKTIAIDNKLVIPYDVLALAPTPQDASYKRLPGLGSLQPSSYERMGVFFLGHQNTGIAASKWLEGRRTNVSRVHVCNFVGFLRVLVISQ